MGAERFFLTIQRYPRDYIDSQIAAKLEATTMHWDASEPSITTDHYYHLAANEKPTAIDSYTGPYQLLTSNADPYVVATIQRLFTKITIAPTLTTSFPVTAPTSITTQGIKFSFDIDSNGKTANVKVIDGASRSNRTEQQNIGDLFRPHFDKKG